MRGWALGRGIFKHGRLAAAAAVAVLCVLAAVSYMFWDERLLAMQQHLYRLARPVWVRPLLQLGKGWLLVWLLLCWAWLTGRRHKAGVALLALLLTALTVLPVKALTARPRPRDVIRNSIQEGRFVPPGNRAFPSGDTASVFAVAAAVAPFVGSARVIFFFAAVLVGVFRVLTAAHYPSDVFAGAAVGIAASTLAYWMLLRGPWLRGALRWLLLGQFVRPAVIIIPAATAFKGLDDFGLFVFCYLPPVALAFLLRYRRARSAPQSAGAGVSARS